MPLLAVKVESESSYKMAFSKMAISWRCIINSQIAHVKISMETTRKFSTHLQRFSGNSIISIPQAPHTHVH